MIVNINETQRNFKKHKKLDIKKLYDKYDLFQNSNTSNSHCLNNISYIRKLKDIILFSALISFIIGLIIFFIKYFTERNIVKPISFNKKINEANKEGYYIPKDNTINPTYKKCSVENCKRCYGNSIMNICTSCLNSYEPIYDENDKIISCNFTEKINGSEIINITNNINDSISEYIIEVTTVNTSGIKTDYITEFPVSTNDKSTKKTTDILKPSTYLPTENLNNNTDNISNSIQEIKSELINQNVTYLLQEETSFIVETTNNKIINCEPGYYLPSGENIQQECKKCSLIGCKTCHGNIDENICDSCLSGYNPIYFFDNQSITTCQCEEKNCIECSNLECLKCDIGYILKEGKCHEYNFKAVYFTSTDNQNLKLISLSSDYIDQIVIDNITISVKSDLRYFIENKGYHIVYFFIKNNPTSFYRLFEGNTALTSVKFSSDFKTKNIINLKRMFDNCIILTSIEFSNFDTSNVLYMNYMFISCWSLTSINLTMFNTEKVLFMNSMFGYCFSLQNLNLSSFNTKNVQRFDCMFYRCSSLTSLILPYAQSNYANINNDYMFSFCSNLTSINLINFDLTTSTSMKYMFQGCSSLKEFYIPDNNEQTFRIGTVKYIDGIFSDCISLKKVNFSNWKFENVINMSYVFSNCTSLETVIFNVNSNYNNVLDISHFFSNCISLESINLIILSLVNPININHMFENCSSLMKVYFTSSNFSRVENMGYMFSGCSSLTSIEFRISNKYSILYLNSFFAGCSSLKYFQFSINTDNVIDISRFFYNCSSILSMQINFNTLKIQRMDEMFYGCSGLDELRLYENFVGDSLISYENMFFNVKKSLIIRTNNKFYSQFLSKYNFGFSITIKIIEQ